MAILDAKSSKVTALGNTYLFGSTIKESVAKSSLATFADGGDKYPMLSLTGYINPVQTGSGDPSPSNVRPITGWTGMNVYRTGKNLYADGNQSFTRYVTVNLTVPLPAGDYTISAVVTSSDTDSTTSRVAFRDINGIQLDYKTLDRNTRNAKTFTLSAPCTQIIFYAGATSNQSTGDTATWADVQIEFGSDTAYEPYTGTTYPISWADEAGTVYGGTLDVTTGLLTVTHQIVDLSSMTFGGGWQLTSDWIQLSTTGLTNVGAMTYLNAIGSMRLCTSSGNAWRFWRLANNQIGITFAKADLIANGYDGSTAASAISAASAYEAGLATHDTIMCPLATPQTYQLTPTEVLSVLGTNNVWCDTGDIEATYIADTKLYIDSKL